MRARTLPAVTSQVLESALWGEPFMSRLEGASRVTDESVRETAVVVYRSYAGVLSYSDVVVGDHHSVVPPIGNSREHRDFIGVHYHTAAGDLLIPSPQDLTFLDHKPFDGVGLDLRPILGVGRVTDEGVSEFVLYQKKAGTALYRDPDRPAGPDRDGAPHERETEYRRERETLVADLLMCGARDPRELVGYTQRQLGLNAAFLRFHVWDGARDHDVVAGSLSGFAYSPRILETAPVEPSISE